MENPNIIFIMADDHGAWALGCANNSEIITPNIDSLAKNGTKFDNFFCVSPVCSAARASIITGRIPSQHGVHDWIRKGNIDDPDGLYGFVGGSDRPIEYLKGLMGYTDILAKNGYNCAMVGKWHLGDSAKLQKGFNHWYTHGFGGGDYYDYEVFNNGKLEKSYQYVTTNFTDKALDYLDTQKESDRPFYLALHYTAPHAPWGREHHPKDIWKMYDDCKFESVPNILNHQWQCYNPTTPEMRREFLQGYYTAVTAMDLEIGRVLTKVKELGIEDNTIIVFTGDNGMNMGHHGIFGKGNGTKPLNMYEESIKVPFIISSPKLIASGKVNTQMYSHYDIFPTILEYLGVENPVADELPGKSFARVLQSGEREDEIHSLVIFDEYGYVRMIRGNDFKYIHRYPNGPHELYDLINDQSEENNLVGNIEYIDKVNEMRNKLRLWFYKYVEPTRDGIYESITGDGQDTLAGIANILKQ